MTQGNNMFFQSSPREITVLIGQQKAEALHQINNSLQ